MPNEDDSRHEPVDAGGLRLTGAGWRTPYRFFLGMDAVFLLLLAIFLTGYRLAREPTASEEEGKRRRRGE